jgi:phosphoglucomutase
LETQEENLRSESNEDEEVSETAKEETADVEEEGGTQVVTRSSRQVTRPSRYAMVMMVARSAWQEEAAKKAIKKELAQLVKELGAIVPVKRTSIPKGVTILKSHMFLVNKYLANGGF